MSEFTTSLSRLVSASICALLFNGLVLAAPSTCPPPIGDGPDMYSGTPANPIPSLPAVVAKLERVGKPLQLSPTSKGAQLLGVHYEGTVTGRYLVPTDGNVSGLSIAGRAYKINSGSLKTACIRTAELGQVLILFAPSMAPGQATVVLTAEQLGKLP